MSRKEKDYNKEVLNKFKKEMASVQRDEIKSNRYTLGKILGKLNIFSESSNDDNEYTVSKINGCDFTRIRNEHGEYAIGDLDGNAVTDFDFVYISKNSLGENDKVIEVITNSGKNKYFNISDGTLD